MGVVEMGCRLGALRGAVGWVHLCGRIWGALFAGLPSPGRWGLRVVGGGVVWLALRPCRLIPWGQMGYPTFSEHRGGGCGSGPPLPRYPPK